MSEKACYVCIIDDVIIETTVWDDYCLTTEDVLFTCYLNDIMRYVGCCNSCKEIIWNKKCYTFFFFFF